MIQKTFFPLLFLFFFTPLFAQNPFIQSQPEKKENSKIISIQQPSSENWFLKKIIGLQNQLNEKMASGLEELKNTNNKALFFSFSVWHYPCFRSWAWKNNFNQLDIVFVSKKENYSFDLCFFCYASCFFIYFHYWSDLSCFKSVFQYGF